MATPAMGWNGWLSTTMMDTGYMNNESIYYAAADKLVSSGLRDAGYDTLSVTCHGWQRDPVSTRDLPMLVTSWAI
jgi:hypothetical protein